MGEEKEVPLAVFWFGLGQGGKAPISQLPKTVREKWATPSPRDAPSDWLTARPKGAYH